jgi:glycosyltransferase involved in cell wall biosynthesis
VNVPPALEFQSADGRLPFVIALPVDGPTRFGVNLALGLAADPAVSPVALFPFDPAAIVLDPFRAQRVAALRDASAPLWDALRDARPSLAAPVVVDFAADPMLAAEGEPTVGLASLQQAALTPGEQARSKRLPLIVAGSSWTEWVLRGCGITGVTTILPGVDTALFHPAPRMGAFPGRFVVFAGGTLSHRGGQDIAVRAFRAFHARRPDALLVAAWSAPPGSGPVAIGDTVPAQRRADGQIEAAGWAIANGIPPQALVALASVPNIAMPHVLREADIALFPSRCQGAPAALALECMACAVPVALPAHTGHLDLMTDPAAAIRLDRQSPADAPGQAGWHDSDVEEIVEALDSAWQDRARAAATGLHGAAFAAQVPWTRQAALLLRAIEPLLP